MTEVLRAGEEAKQARKAQAQAKRGGGEGRAGTVPSE